MSKKKSPAEANEQLPDLSSLDLGLGLGPAWARNEPKKARYQDSDKSAKKRSSSRRDNQGHGGGSRSGGQKRDFSQKRDFKKGGARSPRSRPAPIAPPEGVTGRIMPVEEGLDAMAKQISDTGRTHSVFDLAWLVLGSHERYNVIFESEKEDLYRSKSDQSAWLNQAECMAHFWSAELWRNHYDEEVVDVEAPSGNFPSVARCGMSKKLIAPPNHHSYQQAIVSLHQERFSNMSLEQYKSRLIIETSEEVVAEWKESMTKSSQWTPKAKATQEAEVTKVAEAGKEDVAKAEGVESPKVLDEVEVASSEVSSEAAVEATSESGPVAVPVASVTLSSRRDVEQHFLAERFSEEFEKGCRVIVAGDIASAKLSPGLFSLLRATFTDQKRYPGNVAPILCKQMTGRHLAVFKWKKRLHCGPARPKAMPEGLVMADRPAALYKWVVENPSGNIDKMWEAVLPADIDEELKKQWYHDLHWLINEGQVLLFSDGKLHTAKEQSPAGKPASKKRKSAAKKPSEVKSQKADGAKGVEAVCSELKGCSEASEEAEAKKEPTPEGSKDES